MKMFSSEWCMLAPYGFLALGTLIYQGLMTVFYYRRRGAVLAALEHEAEEVRFN